MCASLIYKQLLLNKQFFTIYPSLLPFCLLPLYVICPICSFHSFLAYSHPLSLHILQHPPLLVLFCFLSRRQRDQLCLVFFSYSWSGNSFWYLPRCLHSSCGSCRHASKAVGTSYHLLLQRCSIMLVVHVLCLGASVVQFLWIFFFLIWNNSVYFTDTEYKSNITLYVKEFNFWFCFVIWHI